MKKLLLLLGFAAGTLLSAAELEYKNAFFEVKFDTKGGVIKNLVHKKELWNGSTGKYASFEDVRVGCGKGPKLQEHEIFSKLDFAVKEWPIKGTNTVTVTFSACGTAFTDLRLEKSYIFNHYRPDELVVEYTLQNIGKTPQNAFLSIRSFFHRTDKNNVYFLPRTKGAERLVQSKYLEFSKLPPKRYLAVAADDKSGMLMQFPADSCAGFMCWFLKEGYPTQEFFSDERTLAPGEKRKITVRMIFARDVYALMARKDQQTVKIKGTIPPQVDQLNQQEDASYTTRAVKPEAPKDTDFVDITMNRQFNDSWRAVTLPKEIPAEKIAVFQLENGLPSMDRPVGFVLKGRELLLFVPGLAPGNSPWRARVIGDFWQSRTSGNAAVGPISFPCRIFFNRTDGKRLDAAAPEGGEIYLNGNFETPDPKNPKLPQYSQFLANPNYRAKWLTEGGSGNSRCLQGALQLHIFPEVRHTYDATLMLKQIGGNARTWFYLTFYDAQGKMMEKERKLLFCSDNAFPWQKVTARFIAPENAAMATLSISRSRKEGCAVLIDDFSLKAAPIPCVKIPPRELARRELELQWNIPVAVLEQFSTAVESPHKKWFFPAEKSAEVLLLTAETGSGRLFNEKRAIVELAFRTPLKVKCIPLIRKVVSSTGGYGVWVMTFKKELSAYTRECLKEIKTAPKLVVLTAFRRHLHDKDLLDILRKFQKEGSNFLFYSCRPPKELLGKKIPSPIHPVIPRMRPLDPDQMITWYQKGDSFVAVSEHSTRINPVLEPDGLTTATFSKVRTGRDYMWWEYGKLPDLQAIRFLSGTAPRATLLAGTEKALEVRAAAPFTGKAEVLVRNKFREEKCKVLLPLKLAAGKNTVKLPEFQLPGGTFIAEIRLLDDKGYVADAGAFRFDRAETLPVTVKLASADRIVPRDKALEFQVLLPAAPAGAEVEAVVEDIDGRVIARQLVPGAKVNAFRMELPAPRTLLNNLIVRIKKGSSVLAESLTEFSSPAGKPDFEEYYGMVWGNSSALKKAMGIDAGTLGGMDWGNTGVYVRDMRLLDADPSPMGMYKYSTTSRLYRGDRKSDPVRTPCFSDPAFHQENAKRLADKSKVLKLRYYDVQNFWSGDEQYLGASVCYSPHCLKLFREVLKKEYGTVEALNKEWGTSFESFDKVIPQQQNELKDPNNLSPWLDHKLFMARVYADGQFGWFARELAKHTSNVKFGPSGTANPGLGYDWYQMMKHCKLLSYYSGIQVKLIHDFGGKEIRAGRWGCYTHAHIDQEPYVYEPMWEGLIRGSNMAAVWPPTMVNGDGTPLRNFFHASRSLTELKRGIAKLWLSAESRPEIALLYSQSSLYCAMNSLGSAEWNNSLSSWVKLLEDLKYDCRFISYEQLAHKGVPPQYKVMILPCSLSLSPAETAKLVEFVKRGGTLIADLAPGRFDGHGKRWNNPALAELFPGSAAPIKPDFKDIPGIGRMKAGEPGLPVDTFRKVGKGRAILLNLALGQYHFIKLGGTGGELSTAVSADAKFQQTCRELVRKYLLQAGVRQDAQVLDAKGRGFPCIGTMRFDGPNRILALHVNGGGKETGRFDFSKAVPVTVKLARKGHVYDVRQGKYLGYTDTFKSALLPAWSRFYAVQSKATKAVRVSAVSALEAGQVLELAVTAEGAEGPQVFHLEVTDPAGLRQAVYAKNYRSEGPSAKIRFQLPFNAAKGKWRAEVTQVSTGLKAVHGFTVK